MKDDQTSTALELLRVSTEIERQLDPPALDITDPAVWGSYLAEIDVSQRSKKEYMKVLKSFSAYLKERGIQHPGRADIIAYKEYLTTHTSARTTTLRMSVLRGYFQWLEFNRLYPNVAYGVKGARITKTPRRQPLTSEQVEEILENIDRSSLKGKQIYLMILMAATTGLRASEMSLLNIEDILTIKNRRYLLVCGKGITDKEQLVAIGKDTDAAIRDCLMVRQNFKPSDPLFISTSNFKKGDRISSRGLAKILKNTLAENGYLGSMYTGHSLRHTACCLALETTGSDLVSVKEFMRHENIETTLVYADHEFVLKSNIAESIEEMIFNEESDYSS